VATVTEVPARLLGARDRGRLEVGARSDVTVLDRDLRVVATIIGGEVAWRS
jgi:N-acetylglucosamine-6-phosphate deacetylase